MKFIGDIQSKKDNMDKYNRNMKSLKFLDENKENRPGIALIIPNRNSNHSKIISRRNSKRIKILRKRYNPLKLIKPIKISENQSGCKIGENHTEELKTEATLHLSRRISNDSQIKINSPTDISFGVFHSLSKTNKFVKKTAIDDYLEQVVHNMIESEQKKAKNGCFMIDQTEINERVREILFRWLVKVHQKFKLMSKTVFLAFSIIDRFSQKCQIKLKNYQLIGITALFIAAKFEEIYPPSIKTFVKVCRSISKSSILKMEGKILLALDFSLLCSTSIIHLKVIKYLLDLNKEEVALASYFLYLGALKLSSRLFNTRLRTIAAVFLA